MRKTTPDVRHKHLVIRAEVDVPPTYPECSAMQLWMSDLISGIGMKELAPPRARYSHLRGNRGMTVDAIIETSHVVLHSWDECKPAILMLDVYTCSELEPDDVLPFLNLFDPIRLEWMFIDREYGLKLVDSSHYRRLCGDLAKRMFRGLTHFWWKR